ncbi:MAG: 16S rRNA (guanine(527)-N(7))-methyltransferase RsmG [Clostridia bacterium]|nr:16S rRNA (guanine(527)-N(7))-methyltransferase RsmG [Clostridia bacterium]
MQNKEKLVEKAHKIGVALDLFHVEQFEKYQELLLEWNEKINLTAITEEEEILNKHFIDSLTCATYIKENDSVIDIGSGAGFPGIPIKIVRKNVKMTLLDSLNKRIVYLKDVIEKLGLMDIETIHGRAEEFGRNAAYREKYDVVTARAVANLKVLSEYCLPFIKVGGRFVCMKGSEYQEEVAEAKAHIKLLGCEIREMKEIVLPDTDIKHSIIVMEKVKNTDKKYPRNKIK